jgi:hypothetical protein
LTIRWNKNAVAGEREWRKSYIRIHSSVVTEIDKLFWDKEELRQRIGN